MDRNGGRDGVFVFLRRSITQEFVAVGPSFNHANRSNRSGDPRVDQKRKTR